MGLDTTHDCWHGPYSAFNNWRRAICTAAGYGSLDDHEGYGGSVPWPDGDVLITLLNHSDCDGNIPWQICEPLADRLDQLVPVLLRKDPRSAHAEDAAVFAAGLRRAHEARENVEFH